MSRRLLANGAVGELSTRGIVDGVGKGLLELLGNSLLEGVRDPAKLLVMNTGQM